MVNCGWLWEKKIVNVICESVMTFSEKKLLCRIEKEFLMMRKDLYGSNVGYGVSNAWSWFCETLY